MQETAVAPPAPQTDAVVTEPEAADSPDVDAPPELAFKAVQAWWDARRPKGAAATAADGHQ